MGWQLFIVNFFLNRWLLHVLFVDGEWLYCPDDGTSKRLSSLLRLSSSLKLLNFHFLKLLHRHVKARGWRQTIHDVWVLERMKGRHPNKPNNQVFSNTNVPMDHSDAGMPYIKLPFWGWNTATNWFCFKAFATCNFHDLPKPSLDQILIVVRYHSHTSWKMQFNLSNHWLFGVQKIAGDEWWCISYYLKDVEALKSVAFFSSVSLWFPRPSDKIPYPTCK